MDKENLAPETKQTTETKATSGVTPFQDKTNAPPTDFRSEILRELAERVANSKPVQSFAKTPVSQKKKKKQFKFGGPSLGQWADTRKKRAEKYSTPVKTRDTPRSSSAKRSATRPRTATRTRPDTPASRKPRRSISQPRSVQRDVKTSTRPNRTPTSARKAPSAKIASTKKRVATATIEESPGLHKNVTVRSKPAPKRSMSQPRLRKSATKKAQNTKEKSKTVTRTKRTKPGRVSRSEHKESSSLRTKRRGGSAPRAASAKKTSEPPTVTKPRATLRSLKKTKPSKTVTSRSSSARTKRTRKRNFRSVEPLESSNPILRKRKRSQSAERAKPTRSTSRNREHEQAKPKRKVVRARRWSHVQPKVDTGLRKPTYVLKEVSTEKHEGMMTRTRKRKLSTLMEDEESKDQTTTKRRRLN